MAHMSFWTHCFSSSLVRCKRPQAILECTFNDHQEWNTGTRNTRKRSPVCVPAVIHSHYHVEQSTEYNTMLLLCICFNCVVSWARRSFWSKFWRKKSSSDGTKVQIFVERQMMGQFSEPWLIWLICRLNFVLVSSCWNRLRTSGPVKLI